MDPASGGREESSQLATSHTKRANSKATRVNLLLLFDLNQFMTNYSLIFFVIWPVWLPPSSLPPQSTTSAKLKIPVSH